MDSTVLLRTYQVASSSYCLTGKYVIFSEDQGAARKFSVTWGEC